MDAHSRGRDDSPRKEKAPAESNRKAVAIGICHGFPLLLELLCDVLAESEGGSCREAHAVSAAVQQSGKQVHVNEIGLQPKRHPPRCVDVKTAAKAIEDDRIRRLL